MTFFHFSLDLIIVGSGNSNVPRSTASPQDQIDRQRQGTSRKIRDDIPPGERRAHQRTDKPVLYAEHIAQRKYLRHLDEKCKHEHRPGEPHAPVGNHDPNDVPNEDHDKSVAKIRPDEGIADEEADEDLDAEKHQRAESENEAESRSFHYGVMRAYQAFFRIPR